MLLQPGLKRSFHVWGLIHQGIPNPARGVALESDGSASGTLTALTWFMGPGKGIPWIKKQTFDLPVSVFPKSFGPGLMTFPQI